MAQDNSSRTLARYIPSPYGLALLSYLVFLFAVLFPPGLYSEMMNEPDLMFMEPGTILFYTLCVIAFISGVWVIDYTFPSEWFPPTNFQISIPTTTFIVLPIVVASAVTIVSIVLQIVKNPLLIVLLLAQSGSQLKEELEIQNTLALSGTWLTGIIWWAVWRLGDLKATPKQKRVIKAFVYFGTLVAIAAASLKLARGEVMPLISGFGTLYLARRIEKNSLDFRVATKFLAFFLVGIVSLFVLFSFARGSEPSKFGGEIVAYSIASYNRLAALISGNLVYPFGGKGVYLSGFLSFNDSFNKIFPIAQYLGTGSFTDVWQSEFDATWRAGLNGYSIWAGAFGYLFADFGWWSPIVVCGYGLLSGAVWRAFKLRRTLGIVVYPWFAFSILFWFGVNYLLDTKVVVLILGAVLLYLYESLFSVKQLILAALPDNSSRSN